MTVHRKVSAALLGGAVSTLVVYGLEFMVVTVPGTVAAAVTTLATFGAGYLTSSD